MTDKIDIIMCSAELTKNTERFAINNANTNQARANKTKCILSEN